MLSKQALEEYKVIHKQETQTVLPDEVLLDEAINLLTLFDRVYRPIKKVWLKEYEQRNNHRLVRRSKREEERAGLCLPQSEDYRTTESN